MQDNNNEAIPAELLDQGVKQLEAEIALIEGWLANLAQTRDDNPESMAVRKSYSDMLHSRKEVLKTLKTR